MHLDLEFIQAQLNVGRAEAHWVQHLLAMCHESGYGDAREMLESVRLNIADEPLDSVLLDTLIHALSHIIEHQARIAIAAKLQQSYGEVEQQIVNSLSEVYGDGDPNPAGN